MERPGFQSTPPCGGDRNYFFIAITNIDFNPRPLAGATLILRKGKILENISIHAPLRGRPGGGGQGHRNRYFNPRPLAGATSSLSPFPLFALFQSTPPCGGDLMGWCAVIYMDEFQSTPPCGGDACSLFPSARSSLFQSTPPCGGDLVNTVESPVTHYFNPRPLAGATPTGIIKATPAAISIHAPLRGRPF